MAYDLRKISSLDDEQWTSSLQNDEDKHGLVANDTDEHHDSVEVALNATPSSRERSGLSFSYALRKVFSREPDVDSKEAQPLSYQYEKPEIHHDDQVEHIEVDGRALAISAAVVDEGQTTLDGAYKIRKAKSCPISPLHEEQSKQKMSLFGKRRRKNAVATKSNDKSLRKDEQKLQKQASNDDESTQCITTANSYADNSYFLEEELQDKSKKRWRDPWVITLIVLVCLVLGMGAFACAYFLPEMLGKADTSSQGYKEIVYTPTDISVSPSSGNGTSITFYAMADAPYTDHERENIMPYQIMNLSSSADFLVHLGDLQDAADGCQESAYQAASAILKQSNIPVFVIPGDNDINDCADFEHGEEQWTKHFRHLDKNWDHSFFVTRWGKLEESFAFLKHRILLFGLNIVGGSPHSDSEWKRRHTEHLHRVKELMTKLKDEYDVAVLLAHASPSSNHADFFEEEDGLASFVKEIGKPFLHLHGDDHVWAESEGAFDVDNYMMVSLDCGEIASPIKVEIDTTKENPIKISREDTNLEVECCKEGWPC
mmetsp:Transcript_28179/g.43559  ORF Transcript_28179/g.43559 Transcript_28179/m.43559 type:complete len:542 (-) Transcript_28179:139-1764(-)